MVQLREKRVTQTCPLCREPLPPGPDKLFDLGWRIYAKIMAVVDPNNAGQAVWENLSLTPAQHRGMDQGRALLVEAAAQGHMDAQALCGTVYDCGHGVVEDARLAFVYHEKAAQQGYALSQYNGGVHYHHGLGCEQSYERAAKWFEKAARQGYANAMSSLGACYFNGMGVPKSAKRAFELFQQSMALGCTHHVLHFNLGQCHDLGLGAAKDYQEARRFYALASAQGDSQATTKLNLLDEKIRTECPLLGKRVVITGTSREDLNGRTGVATSFDHSGDRYVVELDDNTGKADPAVSPSVSPPRQMRVCDKLCKVAAYGHVQ